MASLWFKLSNKKEAEVIFDYKNERMSAFVLKFDGPTNLERIIAIRHSLLADQNTLSETLYHWRKIEPVIMKANFIHFWCVESEFMIKNWFHNWTSELGCIWHIFGKLDYFWLFLSAPVQAASGCCQSSASWSAWKEPKIA